LKTTCIVFETSYLLREAREDKKNLLYQATQNRRAKQDNKRRMNSLAVSMITERKFRERKPREI